MPRRTSLVTHLVSRLNGGVTDIISYVAERREVVVQEHPFHGGFCPGW